MPKRTLEPRDLTSRQRAVGLALVVAVLACAALAQANFILGHFERQAQFEDSIALRNTALAWMALLVVTTVALCRATRRWRLPSWPGRRAWIAVLAALVVLAAWLRFHRLEELPPGLWIDEALNGVQAWQIATSGRPRVALPDEDVRTGLGAGYVDVAGLVFALTQPIDGPYAIRAVAAGIGTVGVAAAAGLGWVLFGPRVAVVATAWLAVSQYHLNYSRWGEMPMMSSVIETLGCLALVVAMRARGARMWIGFLAAGLLAGLGLYTYQTFRLFLVLAVVSGLGLAIVCRRRLAGRWAALAAAVGLALAVAAPMLHYAWHHPEKFGERAQGTTIAGRDDWRAQLAESVPRSLLAFQYIGDENPRHNLPFAPLLTAVPAALAPIGLVVCLVGWRRLSTLVVPAWFGFALVPGIVTLEAPHASRLLDAIVPLAMMVGVAVDRLSAIAQAAIPARRLGQVVTGVATATALAVMAVAEYRAYFVERERRADFVDAFFPYESAPGRYLATRLPAGTVYLDPGSYFSATTQFVGWRYLNDLPADVRMLRLLDNFPPRPPLVGDAYILLARQYLSLAPLVRELMPDARCEDVHDPLGRLDMIACHVPAAAIATLQRQLADGTLTWPYGLRARIYPRADGPAVEGLMLPYGFLDYVLEDTPYGRFARAEFEGEIEIPSAGEYLFRLHPDASSLAIDGREIIAHAGSAATGAGHEGRATLPAGRLPIRIVLAPGAKDPYFLWFLWQPPGRDVELVPATSLHPPSTADVDAAARSD